jgi:hypothetical protein
LGREAVLWGRCTTACYDSIGWFDQHKFALLDPQDTAESLLLVFAVQERRLLFSQGVTLHVQPDGQAWRQFGMLSGGQQALATLALSFALQVRWGVAPR